MSIIASDIRRGMAIIFNGEPCRVLDFHHHTPGNLRAMVQAKLRRLKTGTQIEHRFRSTDTVDVAELETHELDFMYKAGTTYHFMNAENYDQLEIEEDTLGEAAKWMTEGMRILAEFYEGRPIGIQLPTALTFEVAETTPGDEDRDQDRLDQAGPAQQRRHHQRARVHPDRRAGPGEPHHRRVHRPGKRIAGGSARGPVHRSRSTARQIPQEQTRMTRKRRNAPRPA